MEYLEDYRVKVEVEDIIRLLETQFIKKVDNMSFEKEYEDPMKAYSMKQTYEVNQLINEFNFKVYNVRTNFIDVLFYIELISRISSDDVEKKVKFNNYNYWLEYEAESMTIRLVGLLDMVFHIVNEIYNFKVTSDSRFQINICSKLSSNKKLEMKYNKLINAYTNPKIKDLKDERNNFTHNRAPLSKRIEIKENTEIGICEETGKKIVAKISAKSVQNTNIEELLIKIERFIEEFSEILKVLKQEL